MAHTASWPALAARAEAKSHPTRRAPESRTDLHGLPLGPLPETSGEPRFPGHGQAQGPAAELRCHGQRGGLARHPCLMLVEIVQCSVSRVPSVRTRVPNTTSP